MTTEQWLAERTFHHSNFWDIKWLVEEKQRQKLSISLCLPTFNEEKTIGQEIVILKAELADRYPLLDEIAVIDSGSTDRTCEIAESFGADVYIAAEHLPEEGQQRGKGENLWKALYLLEGEIIVSADTAESSARLYGWSVDDELLLYVIHGALHLVGFDDKTPAMAAVMREQEAAHLAPFGLQPRWQETTVAAAGFRPEALLGKGSQP